MAEATLAFFLAPRRIVALSAEERRPTRAEEVRRGQDHQANLAATPRHPVVIQVADRGQVEGRYPDNKEDYRKKTARRADQESLASLPVTNSSRPRS